MFTETSNSLPTNHQSTVWEQTSTERERFTPTLLSVAKIARALLGIELASIGLHQGQDELLLLLDDDKGVAVSALADLLCVRPSTVSKMLDRLMAKNLVERVPSTRDARLTLVRATPAGVAMKRDIAEVWSKIQTCVDGKLTDREVEDRLRHFQAVETALKKKLARLR